MLIEVIGPGCPFCRQLLKRVQEVAAENRIPAQVEHVKDLGTALKYFPRTPVLRVDGEVVHRGKRLPAKEQIAAILSQRNKPGDPGPAEPSQNGAERIIPAGGRKLRVLFLCTGNSCRSQMAEGFARHLRGGVLEAFSAGTEARGLDPRAVRVMAEVGIDISGQRSKTVDEFRGQSFDYIVTVCSDAGESCPLFPGNAKRIHQGFDDPPRLAAGAPSEEEALGHYRRVRDEIKRFVETHPEALAW
jgi:arsenate reductase